MRLGGCVRMAAFGPASALVMTALMFVGLAPQSGAATVGFRTIYSFCSQGGKNCTDGAQPETGVTLGPGGKLYGTTMAGGAHKSGNVFALTPNAAKTKWTEQILYSFCSQGGANCTDGDAALAGVTADKPGNLYGTTYLGGANKHGVVFELVPNAAKTKWSERVLYSFCSQGGAACTDGSTPVAPLVVDPSGRLYGTTLEGGANNKGTVFALVPNAAKTKWAYTVLHNFCSQGGTTCTDGSEPYDGLLLAGATLYGTTAAGGAHKQGSVFALTPNAAKTKWSYAVLHSFCSTGGTTCTDGAVPYANLITDASGKLYGSTYQGGAHNSGAVFALTRNKAKTGWVESVLYSFCSRGCADGALPTAGVVEGKSGDLYGVTEIGGANYSASTEGGVVFELVPNKAKTKWGEAVLYNFCSQGGSACKDGTNAAYDMVIDAGGNLYGMTVTGGAHNLGSVFTLKP